MISLGRRHLGHGLFLLHNMMCVLEWILGGRLLPLMLLLLEGLDVRIDFIKKLALGWISLIGIFNTPLAVI